MLKLKESYIEQKLKTKIIFKEAGTYYIVPASLNITSYFYFSTPNIKI